MRKKTGPHIVIDPEFESLIPPLSAEEYTQLKENILDAGEVRDPIVIWQDPQQWVNVPESKRKPPEEYDYIVLDGHNRWRIIQELKTEHPDVDICWNYKLEWHDVGTRNEAKAWMIRNQLGRRNLPNYERARLALQLKEAIAAEAKANQATHTEQGYQKSDKAVDTNKELAKVAGVSHDTIHKVDVIEQKAAPEVKDQLRRGEMSISKAYNELKKQDKQEDGALDYFHAPKQYKKEFEKIANAHLVNFGIAAALCREQAESEKDELKKSLLERAEGTIADAIWFLHKVYNIPIDGLEIGRETVSLSDDFYKVFPTNGADC